MSQIKVIAINWTEDIGGKKNNDRLNSMVQNFHPLIRVIIANKNIEKYFSPLTRVPTSFIFNAEGNKIYGHGNQEFLGSDKLSEILKNTRKK